MNTSEFRKEIVKIMPGYRWTVHQQVVDTRLVATGIQSSGFNRCSTIEIERKENGDTVFYKARAAGYGAKSPWIAEAGDVTLARALRLLQNHCTRQASIYKGMANALEAARRA